MCFAWFDPLTGLQERAREVLALLCNSVGTHCARLCTEPRRVQPLSVYEAVVRVHIYAASVFDWLSVPRCWWRAAGSRRLGDLRSDFKLYLGTDRSIYLGGVPAIMHGLAVSVAGKINPLCRGKVFLSGGDIWSFIFWWGHIKLVDNDGDFHS